MGLEFHHALGEKKLKILIMEAQLKEHGVRGVIPDEVITEPVTVVESKVEIVKETAPVEKVVVAPPVTKPLTKLEIKVKRHARLRKEQTKLTKIILRSNDDAKKEWKGEFFKVSNILHTITRYVPFDNEDGWHVEQALLNTIQEMKCMRFKDVKLPNGKKHRQGFNIKAFTVEILPQINKEELATLRADQSARGGVD